MSQFEVKVIADSIHNGARLTTFQLKYPRIIHAEFMTHRVFSRNASSSRAIPVAKIIKQVREEPAMPVHWGKNQPGMQAREELDEPLKKEAISLWKDSAYAATVIAEEMMNLGLHKQVANRVLEPYQFMHTVMTTSELDNWFALRDHEDADPNIQTLAHLMLGCYEASEPVWRPRDRFNEASWHLPYIYEEERESTPLDILVKCSVARCARVSYMNHDGKFPSQEEDLTLFDRLINHDPMHASPCEHQAYPLPLPTQRSRNFVGWRQNREIIEATK